MRRVHVIQIPASVEVPLRPARRSGTSVLELVVGAVILSVFLSTLGPMLRWIHVSKRTSEQHLAAMQELSTQMEFISAQPVAELNDEYLQSLTVSETTLTSIPDAELTASVTRDDQKMQRVSLVLSWKNDVGRPVEPKRLTAWFPLEAEGGNE